nr:MAG: hypothetical protein DIU74_04080 [Pseudomonadota bacterium]
MLLAGDERGRTQRGNNNAYCQDNEISWLDWNEAPEREQLFEFTRRLIALRRAHPVFRRREFFQGRPIQGGAKDIVWLKPDGTEMSDEEWHHEFARCLGVYVSGQAMTETDERGRVLKDDDFVLLFNAHHEDLPFVLPQYGETPRWRVLIDSSRPDNGAEGEYAGGERYPLRARSLALLVQVVRKPVLG